LFDKNTSHNNNVFLIIKQLKAINTIGKVLTLSKVIILDRNAYVSLEEASSFLNISKGTLRNWDKKGKITVIRNPINGYRTFNLSELRTIKDSIQGKETSSIDKVIQLKTKLKEKNSSNELNTIRDIRVFVGKIHNILRDTDGESNLIERFDELSKILFYFIERQSKNKSVIKNKIPNLIREDYKKLCSEVNINMPAKFKILNCSDNALLKLFEELNSIDFSKVNFDLKGILYEEVIKKTFDKNDNQQFFTPNQIVEFITEFYFKEEFGKVCDPASGTGGFLVEIAKKRSYKSLTALEIDERLAWISSVNLHLHGAHDFYSEQIKNGGSLSEEALKYEGTFDNIITNPPFGSDYSDKTNLKNYKLGFDKQSRRRGILFIERCYQLLKEKGKLAIIIDDGILNLNHAVDVREFIINHFKIDAIVSLPDSTFLPYAFVKSSILFLTKSSCNKKGDNKIFFAKSDRIGRKNNGDEDFKFNKLNEQYLNSDLNQILYAWHLKKENTESENIYSTNLSKITSEKNPNLRIDFSFHHPRKENSDRYIRYSKNQVLNLADICDERNEVIIPSKELPDNNILYTGLAHIQSFNGIAYQELTPTNLIKSSVKKYKKGDLIFSKMRPSLRKCSFINFKEEGYTSPECVVLIPLVNKEGMPIIDPYLLSYLLRSDFIFGQISHLIAGIGRPRLTKKDIFNLKIPVPSQIEQKRILKDLKKSESKIASLKVEIEEIKLKELEIKKNITGTLINSFLGID